MRHKQDIGSDLKVDAAFEKMARDEGYRKEALTLSQEFEKSDWEAFQASAQKQRGG